MGCIRQNCARANLAETPMANSNPPGLQDGLQERQQSRALMSGLSRQASWQHPVQAYSGVVTANQPGQAYAEAHGRGLTAGTDSTQIVTPGSQIPAPVPQADVSQGDSDLQQLYGTPNPGGQASVGPGRCGARHQWQMETPFAIEQDRGPSVLRHAGWQHHRHSS